MLFGRWHHSTPLSALAETADSLDFHSNDPIDLLRVENMVATEESLHSPFRVHLARRSRQTTGDNFSPHPAKLSATVSFPLGDSLLIPSSSSSSLRKCGNSSHPYEKNQLESLSTFLKVEGGNQENWKTLSHS